MANLFKLDRFSVLNMMKAYFSPRRCSTVVLCTFLINNFTALSGLIPEFRNMIFAEFLKNNNFIAYYALMSFLSMGSLIYLAAIVSIIKDRPSKYLLYGSIVVLLFTFICWIYAAFQIFSNGVFEDLVHTDIETKAKQRPLNDQDEFRAVMRIGYTLAKINWILGFVLYLFNLINAVSTFSSFINDLKMKEIEEDIIRIVGVLQRLQHRDERIRYRRCAS